MADKRRYRLINGDFDPEEARELLMTLFVDKINFHQRNNLSRRERGLETDASIERIEKLRGTKADVAAMLEEAIGANNALHIDCSIDITLTAK